MKGLSRWAFGHKTSARILIALLHIILAILAIQLGLHLTETNRLLPESMLYISAALYLFIMWAYNKCRRVYWMRKLNEFTIVLLGFTSMTVITNHLDLPMHHGMARTASATPLPSTHPLILKLPVTPTSGTLKSKKAQRKELKSTVKKFLKEHRKGQLKKSNRDGYIVLLVLLALVLAGLLGALVCNIACTGSSGGAIMLGIFGLAAIIFGLSKGIRAIKKKYPKTTQTHSSP